MVQPLLCQSHVHVITFLCVIKVYINNVLDKKYDNYFVENKIKTTLTQIVQHYFVHCAYMFVKKY